MKTINLLLTLVISTLSAFSYWPTDVYTDLVISADPNFTEGNLSAHPGAQGETIVLYYHSGYGICYNIIDQYGEFKFPNPQILAQVQPGIVFGIVNSLSDGQGGMYAIWNITTSSIPADEGFYAQRIDSLGNLMWTEPVHFFWYPETYGYDFCLADNGGFYFVSIPDDPISTYGALRLQYVDSEGDMMFDYYGIILFYEINGCNDPRVTVDGQGGCFVAWEHPPQPNSGIFLNRYDSQINPLWPSPELVHGPAPLMDAITDSAGGVIISLWETTFSSIQKRIGSNGNIVWTRSDLSSEGDPQLLTGANGYFYLGFINFNTSIIYGQKVRVSDGVKMWNLTTWGTQIFSLSAYSPWFFKFFYNSPYFDVICGFEHRLGGFERLYIQRVDSLGNIQFNGEGYFISREDFGHEYHPSALFPDTDGMIAVFMNGFGGQGYELYAKRCYFDGTLGGPNMQIKDLTITIQDSNAVLTWPSQAPGADYLLRFSDNPYSFPQLADTTISDTVFIDVNALQEGVKFYDVRWQP